MDALEVILIFLGSCLFVVGFYVSYLPNNILYGAYLAYQKYTAMLTNWLTRGRRNELMANKEVPFEFWITQTTEELAGLIMEDQYFKIITDQFKILVEVIEEDYQGTLRTALMDSKESYEKRRKEMIQKMLPFMIPFYLRKVKRYEKIRSYLAKPLFTCVFCMPSVYVPIYISLLSVYNDYLDLPSVFSFGTLVWVVCLCGFNYLLSIKLNIK